MSFNGSGTFVLNSGGLPYVTGTTISSTTGNNLNSDLASGLSTCITKDGQTTVTANLPMATFRHTSVGAASAATDYARYDQVQNSAPTLLASVAGTNTITATASPTPTYTVGQVFRFVPANTNTGATTLNINSQGAGAVQIGGNALVGGELIAGKPIEVFVSAATPVFQIVAGSNVVMGVPGMVIDYAGSTVPAGWLECDGSVVVRATYPALFAAISTTWNKGGEAGTDFRLPDFRDKSRIGKGTGTVVESVTNAEITTGTDAITVASNNTKWVTGMQVTWTVSGTPPTTNPANLLDNADTVFIVRIDATTVKVATTLANAQNGTVIDITNAGSGTFTMTHTYTARTLGEYGGEEAHAMSSTELLAHTHGVPTPNVNCTTSSPESTVAFNANTSGTSSSTGGNARMNIMSPFAVTMAIIKT